MVQAAATFRKSGFNDQDAATLAEVAATFQNVADTALSADDAAASIISQLRAYGETADWATHVIDAYNEVANTQAVGTNDLATAMEVASAAMATYGNEFEQVLGLTTAGVEVMQGRPAQVARGLSTIAARIVKNQEALAEYGITVEDANGNLKSTYDVLAELKPKWDEMTDAQRTALGDTIAGTNQYKVLASVMSNFDSAITATATAYNSAGSAAQENERYMESLEAQTNNLKATFQDFANNVVNKEMISSVLNLANAFLELLNTPFGQAATRIVLVTTALTGLMGVLKGYMAFMKGGAIISTITKIFSVAGPGVGIIERIAVALGGINPVVAGVTAGITALGLAIYGVKKYVDEVNKPLSDFNEEIDSINGQLQNNQTRLDEINAMPWNARTSEILEEKAALEKQNEELEKNLELLNQEKYERAQEEAEKFVFNTGEQKTITKGGSTSRRMSTTFDVTVGGEKAYAEAARQLEEYRHQLEQTGQITDDQRKRFDEVNAAVAEQIEWLQVLVDRGDTLTESQQRMYDAYYALGDAYDVAVNGANALINAYTELTNTGYITEATYQQLIALYPQLADGAVQTANGYQIEQSALENLMSAETRQQAQIQNTISALAAEGQQLGYTSKAFAELVSAQITASNTGLNVSQQIAALQALAVQAGYSAQAIAQVFAYANAMGTYQADTAQVKDLAAKLLNSGKAKSVSEAFNMAKKQLTASAWGNLTTNYVPTIDVPRVSVPSASPAGSGGKTSSTADDSKRSEAQAQIKQLQSQQDVIQDKIDSVNEKYDAQLKELEDINDALEEQIQLQKLLQALTEAKASKKMVFKDGRFQYLSDVDAIAKAQSNLEEFYQEQELKKKKKRIEEERQAELEGLNAEKKYLSDRISAWRDYLSDMSWQYGSSLSGLQSYVNSWNAEIDRMKEPPKQTGGTTDPTPPKQDDPKDNVVEDPLTYEVNKNTAAKYPSKPYNTIHNDEYDKSTTKKIQTWYGTPADGIWGKNSYAAAGNRNIDAAAGLYYAVKETYSSFSAFKAKGGYATGTLSAQSGISMVGEQGPELRVLNKGDGIIPAKQTATLWSFANDPAKFLQNLNNIGGKTEVINVANVSLPNVQNPQEFISGLRNLAYQRTYKPNFGTV